MSNVNEDFDLSAIADDLPNWSSPMFSDKYEALLANIYTSPDCETEPRGKGIKEIIDGSITLDDPKNCLASWPDIRELPHDYLLAEFGFYLSGRRSSKEIGQNASLWNDISRSGRITSNYGRLIFCEEDHFVEGQRVNAFYYAANKLLDDTDSRRAVMKYLRPEHLNSESNDVTCTISSQFLIRDGELHQIVNMRSSDVVFGLTFDLPWHSIVQQQMLMYLNARSNNDFDLGFLKLRANSMHLYERHYDLARSFADNDRLDKADHSLELSSPLINDSAIIRKCISKNALKILSMGDLSGISRKEAAGYLSSCFSIDFQF